jgi:hypothetical protein
MVRRIDEAAAESAIAEYEAKSRARLEVRLKCPKCEATVPRHSTNVINAGPGRIRHSDVWPFRLQGRQDLWESFGICYSVLVPGLLGPRSCRRAEGSRSRAARAATRDAAKLQIIR